MLHSVNRDLLDDLGLNTGCVTDGCAQNPGKAPLHHRPDGLGTHIGFGNHLKAASHHVGIGRTEELLIQPLRRQWIGAGVFDKAYQDFLQSIAGHTPELNAIGQNRHRFGIQS